MPRLKPTVTKLNTILANYSEARLLLIGAAFLMMTTGLAFAGLSDF
jgi:hypothetical protein